MPADPLSLPRTVFPLDCSQTICNEMGPKEHSQSATACTAFSRGVKDGEGSEVAGKRFGTIGWSPPHIVSGSLSLTFLGTRSGRCCNSNAQIDAKCRSGFTCLSPAAPTPYLTP